MHIVIIGNGIAGVTAARHIRKLSDHSITVISSESDHFFSRTALMYIYMGHMKYEHTKPYEDWFWEKNNINLINDHVTGIERVKSSIALRIQGELSYDRLIIATGSHPRMLDWPGSDLEGVQGLYSLQDLEQMEHNTREAREAVVVGGGLIGIEMAEMLASRGIRVTFLVREESFWDMVLPPEESRIINEHIRNHGIDLKLSTELQAIKGKDGRVTHVITDNGEEIPCQFAGITIGVTPNKHLAEECGLKVNQGIQVDEYLRTDDEHIYAIGDCAELTDPRPGRKAIEPVWYTGRMMGETVASTICGTPAVYDPGVWFNSAKFLNLEYQTYGTVPVKKQPGMYQFFWQGQSKCLRIIFSTKGHQLLGMNAIGIRLDHRKADQWIYEKRDIGKCIRELDKLSFDPEFSAGYINEIQERFREQFPEIPFRRGSKNLLKRIL